MNPPLQNKFDLDQTHINQEKHMPNISDFEYPTNIMVEPQTRQADTADEEGGGEGGITGSQWNGRNREDKTQNGRQKKKKILSFDSRRKKNVRR